MAEKTRRRFGLGLFLLKFIVLIFIVGSLWWSFLPYYTQALGALSGFIARVCFGVPVEDSGVTVHGFLNVESTLDFVIGGRGISMPIAILVTNVAPYIALVLATAGLGWRRRVKILAMGVFILSAGHVAFISVLLGFQEQLIKVPELPTAITQFYLTLPFLLWIVLAYWDRLRDYFQDAEQHRGAE